MPPKVPVPKNPAGLAAMVVIGAGTVVYVMTSGCGCR